MASRSNANPRFGGAINALTVGYVVALAIIGAIAATAHIVTEMVIDAQTDNAHIVNVTGRQRMLSQRIVMLAGAWHGSGESRDYELLSGAIDAFERAHNNIVAGRTGRDTAMLPSEVSALMFAEPQWLDAQVREHIARARTVAEGGPNAAAALSALFDAVLVPATAPNSLLYGLNAVVKIFEEKHSAQLQRMKRVQSIALAVLAVALALEAVLIFRPLVRRVNTLGESLRTASVTDPMTGLTNRRGFMLLGEALSAQRQRGALIIIDIDHFKGINDTYGHSAGDACIKHLAAVAKTIFRTGDVLARIGGEEFAAALQGVDEQDTLMVAERLRRAVETTPCDVSAIRCGTDTIAFTISLGVCTFAHPRPLSELLHDADAALYRAKHAGRNQVQTALDLDTTTFRLAERPTEREATPTI
ncbi:MAG: diguanylate cyclase [Pseudomonadota bacterium]